MSTIVLSGADRSRSGAACRRCSINPTTSTGSIDADVTTPTAHDLKASLEGAAAVIQLERRGGRDAGRCSTPPPASAPRRSWCCRRATVYGAWPTNPVPLTEDAPLRPNPELDFAVRAAERERLGGRVEARTIPASTVAILRPAIPVAEDGQGWLARAVRGRRAVRPVGPDDPPLQYVHLDDLAERRRAGVAPPARRSLQRGPRRMDPGRRGAGARRRASGAGARSGRSPSGVDAMEARTVADATGAAAVHGRIRGSSPTTV